MTRGVRRGCVRLKGAVIGIDDEDDCTFTITVDGKTFHFQARDADERERWIRSLEDTILRHANRHGCPNFSSSHTAKTILMAAQKHLMRAPEQFPQIPDGPADNWEAFGLSVGGDLRKLPDPQQTVAQKLISDVIYLAKLGRLSEETTISHLPIFTPSSSSIPPTTARCTPSTCSFIHDMSCG